MQSEEREKKFIPKVGIMLIMVYCAHYANIMLIML
jgi:hypothetical protein